MGSCGVSRGWVLMICNDWWLMGREGRAGYIMDD